MFEWLLDPSAWMALATLTLLEIVLGIDNIIFISILVGRLPAEQRQRARILGLAGAMVTRVLLLLSLAWVMRLTTPLFSIFDEAISGRDLILILGGLFLLAKSTHEIHSSLEGSEEGGADGSKIAIRGFYATLVQIAILDIVFSLDSVITAVGIADHIPVMVCAVLLAVAVMLLAANPLGRFIDANPTVKMLALTFILLVGVVLILDGLEVHVPKPYIYFAMGFSVLVEWLNLLMRRKAVAHKVPGAGEW